MTDIRSTYCENLHCGDSSRCFDCDGCREFARQRALDPAPAFYSNGDEHEREEFTLGAAVYIVRDGLDLLDVVDSVDDSKADEGALLVSSEEGAFSVHVRLEKDEARFDIAARNGGVWGEHPDHSLEDWRYEVANNDTRQGYWGWVSTRIEAVSDAPA